MKGKETFDSETESSETVLEFLNTGFCGTVT